MKKILLLTLLILGCEDFKLNKFNSKTGASETFTLQELIRGKSKEKVREKEKSSKNTQNKYLLTCAWCSNSFDGRYGWARFMGIIQQCDMNVNSDNWAYMTECSKRCATEHLRSIRGY